MYECIYKKLEILKKFTLYPKTKFWALCAVVVGNPLVVSGNPPVVVGNPPVVVGNPPVVSGNPPVVVGNPVYIQNAATSC
jgi:hypothetical protein